MVQNTGYYLYIQRDAGRQFRFALVDKPVITQAKIGGMYWDGTDTEAFDIPDCLGVVLPNGNIGYLPIGFITYQQILNNYPSSLQGSVLIKTPWRYLPEYYKQIDYNAWAGSIVYYNLIPFGGVLYEWYSPGSHGRYQPYDSDSGIQ